VAFTHCRDVVVAVSKAGGSGVLGAGWNETRTN
jgi:2-nitropropane dioxygenase.